MAVKICRFCLALGARVYKLGNSEAKCFIENIFRQSGHMQDLDENHYICFECKALLEKSYKFIKRVLKAQEILFNLMQEHKIITPQCIKQIDRQVIGFNLVKDIKYTDVFITEDNEIKTEDKSHVLQECKTEIDDDFDMSDPLDNLLEYKLDKKDIDIDFGVDFQDGFTDKKSKILTEIPGNPNSLAGQFNESDLDDANIQYEFIETIIEQVKEEILEESDNNEFSSRRRKKNSTATSQKPKINCKKSVNKVQPSTSKSIKQRCTKKSVETKRTKKCKPKNKKGGRQTYSREYPEPYDGLVNSGQQIQQPDIPKYPAKCDHCSYEVPNRTAHFHHYLLEHKDKKYPYAKQTGKQFICQFCGLVNSLKSRHIDHELTHGTESNFTCSQCPKSFVNKRRLQKHTYRSHPLQMLECDYCGKKVKSRESLMIHIRAHTGERPFKCPFCGAGFAHRGNIRPHIRANHKKYLDQPDFPIKTNGNTFYDTTDVQILAPENNRVCATEMFMHLNTVMNNLQ